MRVSGAQQMKDGTHPSPFNALFFSDLKPSTAGLTEFSGRQMVKPGFEHTTFHQLSTP